MSQNDTGKYSPPQGVKSIVVTELIVFAGCWQFRTFVHVGFSPCWLALEKVIAVWTYLSWSKDIAVKRAVPRYFEKQHILSNIFVHIHIKTTLKEFKRMSWFYYLHHQTTAERGDQVDLAMMRTLALAIRSGQVWDMTSALDVFSGVPMISHGFPGFLRLFWGGVHQLICIVRRCPKASSTIHRCAQELDLNFAFGRACIRICSAFFSIVIYYIG